MGFLIWGIVMSWNVVEMAWGMMVDAGLAC